MVEGCEVAVVQVPPWDEYLYQAYCFTCAEWVGPARDWRTRELCHDDTTAHRYASASKLGA